MKSRAAPTVARCRERLQKRRNSKIASRYACRSKSRSRAWASASAHLGNQTPSVDEKGFIEQLCKAELTLGLEICYDKLNLPGTKAENRA